MSKYSIEKASMDAIADGVRWRTGRCDKMSVAEMTAELNNPFLQSLRITQTGWIDTDQWIRPADWPDLDSLNLEMTGEDFIYMTYDAEQKASAIAWRIVTADGLPATLEIGRIENGVYKADETYSVNNNTTFSRWTDDLSGYIVIRITGKISQCYCPDITENGRTQKYSMQPICERIAYLPHLTRMRYGGSTSWTSGYTTLERDRVANGDGSALANCDGAYYGCYNLRSLDISGLRTPNVTVFTSIFYQCEKLTSLDLRHLDVSHVTNMGSLFSGCYGLKEIDIRGWDTSKVESFQQMFAACRSLRQIIGLEDFDTGNATTFYSMFDGCRSLYELNVAHFDTGKVTNTYAMFSGCFSLTELDLSNWNVHKLNHVNSMFSSCHSLKRLRLDGWQTGPLMNVSGMFYGCRSLQTIDVSWMHLTSACTNIYNLFSNCWAVKTLDIPDDWDLSGLGTGNVAANIFSNCYSVEHISGIRCWKFSGAYSISSIFQNCQNLRVVDVSGWDVSTITNMSNMFQYCYCLENVDLTGWQPQNCTNFAGFFNQCYSLKSFGNIDHWDMSKATTLSSFFSDCQSLDHLPDLETWDVRNVTSLASMCAGMNALRKVQIRNWDLASCTTIATMFRYCYNLQSAELTGWNIPKLTTTPAQFLGDCYALHDLYFDIPIELNWSVANTNLSYESTIRILNALPVVSTRRTLILGFTKIGRLTAEEKQIATDKNWTLAN